MCWAGAGPGHSAGTGSPDNLFGMSDQNTPADQPLQAPEAPENADTPEVASKERGPSRWQRLRSRAGTVGKGTVVALVAGLVLGSAGGLAAGAVLVGDDHGGDQGHDGRHGRAFGDGEMGHGFGPPPGGQLPPTTAPDDFDDLSGAEPNG
jgi:hypothetical protein